MIVYSFMLGKIQEKIFPVAHLGKMGGTLRLKIFENSIFFKTAPYNSTRWDEQKSCPKKRPNCFTLKITLNNDDFFSWKCKINYL